MTAGAEIQLDWARAARTGAPEAVYSAGKSPEQLAAILAAAEARQASLLFTRLRESAAAALPGSERLDYDPVSGTAILDHGLPALVDRGVAVVAAGTSDAPTAREAVRTLAFSGVSVSLHMDVGVAGLWRTLAAAEALQDKRVIIAVAGFEAALFSVLAGLVRAPVIAVPSPVGEGVAAGGQAALTAALASCAPGVLAVNIGNGFGAACAALKILEAADRWSGPPSRQEAPP